ncbi:hypothetical protein PIB30_074460 [Stylosanthes scabra]|uniref:Uncharacterized protein n=1 Tax=Stylosanthes scabra TaxID=79078 RepID=A0ABU6TRX3_9FABA|nr:hypothetical protein [Stylosanthes scabra]
MPGPSLASLSWHEFFCYYFEVPLGPKGQEDLRSSGVRCGGRASASRRGRAGAGSGVATQTSQPAAGDVAGAQHQVISPVRYRGVCSDPFIGCPLG